jgi:ubiquinol-cytochrome c reductase iron-sulfur subunit
MSIHTETAPETEPDFDAEDPRLTRFDLVREGARRDGVEIVLYAPRFPVRGTRAEKRITRTIKFMLTISVLAGTAFVVFYIAWPWRYEPGSITSDHAVLSKIYTPILGVLLGLTLLMFGMAIITIAKKLLPEEVSVQDRHDGPSDSVEQKLTVATIQNMGDELGIKRRPAIIAGLALGGLPLTAAILTPIIGSLIKSPHKDAEGASDALYFHTGFDADIYNNGNRVYLARMDGTKIRPEEVSVGGQITVFPLIFDPETKEFTGASNAHADSPTLLIHLRDEDAAKARENAQKKPVNIGSQWGNLVAYSKICSHAGCPASLYEQQTNRLLCPCHQSQFLITDNARPVFGPASRALAQLPIDVDDDGYLYAKSDYRVPIGPGFWERP